MTNPLRGLIQPTGIPGAAPVPPVPAVARMWATVTSTTPLRVHVDGDDEPLDASPINLVPGLTTGARVRVEIDRRQLIITGRIQA